MKLYFINKFMYFGIFDVFFFYCFVFHYEFGAIAIAGWPLAFAIAIDNTALAHEPNSLSVTNKNRRPITYKFVI